MKPRVAPGAFATDIAYWITRGPTWATASMWLFYFFGSERAAKAMTRPCLASQRIRGLNDAWLHMGGNLIAVVLAAINWYLQFASIDPARPVLSAAIWLSLATVLLLYSTAGRVGNWFTAITSGWLIALKEKLRRGRQKGPPDQDSSGRVFSATRCRGRNSQTATA